MLGYVLSSCMFLPFFNDNYFKLKYLSLIFAGMLSPGILVIILGFLTCNNRYTAVVLLTIGLTANGACFAGIFVNHVDIAPRYAGVLFAICNSIASITGFFAPYVVGAVTTTVSYWREQLAALIDCIQLLLKKRLFALWQRRVSFQLSLINFITNKN